MSQAECSTARRLHQMAARVIRCVRPPNAWPGAAAALAAAVAASSLLLAGCAAGTSTRRTAGTTMQREAISRALVAADGRQIVVPYTTGGCVRGAVLTAAETALRVTLVLRKIVSGSICPADFAIGTASVTLRRPLWRRSLVDGTTGRLVPYFDGRRLRRVTYLPSGYRFSAYLPFPSVPAASYWEREFISSGPAQAPVDVVQVPGNVTAEPSWPVASRITVDGRPATVGVLSANGQVVGRAIAWRAGGFTFAVYSVMVRAGQRLLSAAELTGIAAGLRS